MSKKLDNLINNIDKKGNTSREFMVISSEGKYCIRLLQNLLDEESAPFEIVKLHGGFIHPKYNRPVNTPCLLTKDCPMCLEARKIKQENPSNAWKYEAKPYYLYNVIDRNDGRLKILKLNQVAHEVLILKIKEKARQGINIMHFFDGNDLDVTVRSVNGKLNYKFDLVPEKENKNVSHKILEEIKIVKTLDKAYRIYSKEEMEDIVDGVVTDYKELNRRKYKSKAQLIENLNKTSLKKEEKIEKIDLNNKINDLNIFLDDSNEKGDK